MSEDLMLKCLIAFILGWIISRMMGDGFSVGGVEDNCEAPMLHLQYIDPDTGKCKCIEHYYGDKCGIHCVNGSFNSKTKDCICNTGYKGKACDIH